MSARFVCSTRKSVFLEFTLPIAVYRSLSILHGSLFGFQGAGRFWENIWPPIHSL